MGLNIKNERVHALARRAAEVTGKTQTGAIEEALERLLADHERNRDEFVAEINEIAARWRANAVRPLDDMSTDFLYDDIYDEPGDDR